MKMKNKIREQKEENKRAKYLSKQNDIGNKDKILDYMIRFASKSAHQRQGLIAGVCFLIIAACFTIYALISGEYQILCGVPLQLIGGMGLIYMQTD